MTVTSMTSRKFNQDTSGAKRAARRGPVFITDRGHPAHVLLSIEQFRKLSEQRENILDQLAMPEAAAIDFKPPRLKSKLFAPADFS